MSSHRHPQPAFPHATHATRPAAARPLPRSAPIELDLDTLKHVAGGSPKGTWEASAVSAPVDSPKGTW